ncbi:hypothetical protein N7520_000397 [Penicillium odoratum]|uniref:uncharacterized protein n=1 Tax=Penicillium odoratum TaxID=1167516 RepID=UPI0025481140|nr:uncharacterized protein N7520_000397 [Penicillium odoratum]KAJ5777151.1 hypothetical protein N7520_000397 [Penicillium odoratum]
MHIAEDIPPQLRDNQQLVWLQEFTFEFYYPGSPVPVDECKSKYLQTHSNRLDEWFPTEALNFPDLMEQLSPYDPETQEITWSPNRPHPGNAYLIERQVEEVTLTEENYHALIEKGITEWCGYCPKPPNPWPDNDICVYFVIRGKVE